MGGVWAVTMVRDEIDIIKHTICHMASEGVEGIIVGDNRSADGTSEWLHDNVSNLACAMVVEYDGEIGYYQSTKMTRLAHMAFKLGAEWVIPFDADEIWYNASQHLDLATTLAGVRSKYDCVEVRLHNYFGSSEDDPNETNPVRRITRRDPKCAPLPKVVIRNRSDVEILQGNHNATWTDPAYRASVSIEVGHFPWRSPEQFETKVRNGAEAYAATDLPDDMGGHWRGYGQILEEGGPDALRAVFDEWFFDPDLKVVSRPVPYCRFGDGRTPRYRKL